MAVWRRVCGVGCWRAKRRRHTAHCPAQRTRRTPTHIELCPRYVYPQRQSRRRRLVFGLGPRSRTRSSARGVLSVVWLLFLWVEDGGRVERRRFCLLFCCAAAAMRARQAQRRGRGKRQRATSSVSSAVIRPRLSLSQRNHNRPRQPRPGSPAQAPGSAGAGPCALRGLRDRARARAQSPRGGQPFLSAVPIRMVALIRHSLIWLMGVMWPTLYRGCTGGHRGASPRRAGPAGALCEGPQKEPQAKGHGSRLPSNGA